MRSLLKNTLIALLCLAIAGNAACTSMHTIDATAGAVEEQSIEPGDKVELRYKDYSAQTITVSAIGETGISGTTDAGETITAEYEELESVMFSAIDGRKTAKNTAKAVGMAALYAIVAGVAIAGAAAQGFSYQ